MSNLGQYEPRQIMLLIYIFIAFSRKERMHPNFVKQAWEIEIFCQDCKLAAPLGFFSGFGPRFVYIDDFIPVDVSFSGGASGVWISSLRCDRYLYT